MRKDVIMKNDKKTYLPKVLLILGFIMPFLGPVFMVVGTKIYLYIIESSTTNDFPLSLSILRGIYFGIMLGIVLIIISKVVTENAKKRWFLTF